MTTTPRLKRRNYGRGHGYTIDGHKVPGVTTILKALPKDALIGWAANVTAEHAVDHWDELTALGPAARLKRLQDARWNKLGEASLRGTQIHDLGEKVSRGAEVNVPDAHVGPVEAYARFCDFWGITALATEAPCANTRHGYAGTLDAHVGIERLGITRASLDIKTGNGVYSEAALQVAAYDACDIWQPDGPASEEPMPRVEASFVAHIRPDHVLLLPVERGPEVYRQFRYAQETHRWMERTKEIPLIHAPLDEDGHEDPSTADRVAHMEDLIEDLTTRLTELRGAEA